MSNLKTNTMIHFKDLLKENKFCSSIDVTIDPMGEVVNFVSDFGNETLSDIQRLVKVLIGKGCIKLNGTTRNVSINIDDIGDEDPYSIDVYHEDDEEGDDNSVITFNQEFIDEVYKDFDI